MILATSNAGLNGLSVYFLCNYYFIFAAVKISLAVLRKNKIKFLIVLLFHIKAYISQPGMVLTISAHSPYLSVSYDKKPDIKIWTTLQLTELSLSFFPLDRQTNYSSGRFYLKFSKPFSKMLLSIVCKYSPSVKL